MDISRAPIKYIEKMTENFKRIFDTLLRMRLHLSPKETIRNSTHPTYWTWRASRYINP
jgi:hypothetical protein